ncbi:MAG: hypothetical protein Q9200_004169 [Gallowayella weberi]
MKQLLSLLSLTALLVSQVFAFPRLNQKALHALLKPGVEAKGCPLSHPGTHQHTKRQLTFDPEAQHVSTSGAYAWKAPNLAAGDKRGPCPGLNALANHGYLPHNGIAPIADIIQAVSLVYGLALDLGGFLAAYGTVFDGDALSLTPGYSIGGPATPQQYSALFKFRQSRFNYSIETNPYFFFPQFAGVLVTPAGYIFPPALMSNKSAKYPEGYLDKETFKSFFAITGERGNFKYQPGYERIPDNWYKRAIGHEFTIVDFVLAVLEFGLHDPRLLSVGGNTGTPNSFTGINVTALTKGVFNGATLAQGNNLQCFIFQLIQAEAPSVLTGLYEDLTKALQPLVDSIQGSLKGLECPQLVGLDQSQYEKYPGWKKNPSGL